MSIPPIFTRLRPLALLLLTAACQQRRPAVHVISPASMKQLEGTWLSSREEDRDDTLVYRPNTHWFPPTRGRTGFTIKTFGRFEQFDVAPTDGLIVHSGTWTPTGPTRLHIHLTDGQDPDYTLEIISLEKQVLKLRRL